MNRETAGEMNSEQIENGSSLALDFEKLRKVAQCEEGVVPVGVQDVQSGELLIIAYVNEIALKHTLKTGYATFWSTSRNKLWLKGETSGDRLKIEEILVNCEQNSLVYKVSLEGKGSCHTKNKEGQARFGCYYRKVLSESEMTFLPGQE